MIFDVHFKHKYLKLDYPIFPTVRGIGAFNKYQVGNPYQIKVARKDFCGAKLIYKKQMPIHALPIDFIKWDSMWMDLSAVQSCLGDLSITIKYSSTPEEFRKLLNSFYPRTVFSNLQLTLDSTITVLIFEKSEEI